MDEQTKKAIMTNEIITHLGEDRKQYYNAVAPPIIQSSNFAFDTIEDLRNAISDELNSHIYTRGNNPTVEILRKKLAALEHAEDALVLSSGASAVAAAVMSNCKAGDHIVCVQKPYSWTQKLLTKFLHKFGVTHDFVDATDIQTIKAHIKSNSVILYLESPNSLSFEIQDLTACAQLAKQHGLITIIDNSYCTPLNQNPIDHGIDLVVHSGTKYLNGHSDVLNGVICGSHEMIRNIFNSSFMTLGMCISAHDASLIIRGLRTLPIRMERIEKTTQTVIAYLDHHEKVESILYPFHPSFKQYDLAKKQMRGCGGLFSIILKSKDKNKINDFVNRLDKFLMAVSWGGYESLKMPTLAFHDIPGLEDSPLPYNMVRLSIGLEDADYLIKNLEEALSVI